MADRELHVKITGDASSLKQAAGEAEARTESFAGKVGGIIKGLAAFAAGSALASFFKGAADAVVEFEGSTRKLESTAKITGTALANLQGLAQKGQRDFGLSATLANDYAVELAKVAAKAGDVGKATPLLGAFLDLGAAKGLSASDTLKAVQQAILGIDEGTDKLFNKNPSVLYKEYADSIGTSVGKLSDQDKAIALVNAALQDGGKVTGAYGDYLKSFGGQLSVMAVRWNELKVAIGQAVFETQGGRETTDYLVASLIKLRQWVEKNEGSITSLVGSLARATVGIGEFFGKVVDVVRWFDKNVKTADAYWQSFFGGDVKKKAQGTTTIVTEQLGNTEQLLAEHARATQKIERDGQETRAQQLKRFHDDVESQTRINATNVYLLLSDTQKKLHTLNQQTADDWQTLQDKADAARNQLTGLLPIDPKVAKSLEEAAFKAELLGDAFYDPKAPEEGVAGGAQKANDSSLAFARALLDVGSAAGVVDDTVAGAVTSVLNLVDSVGRLGVDPTAGIVGIIGALANLIGGWGSSAVEKARHMAVAANTAAIQDLTTEVGDYNGSTSGRKFQGVLGVLDTLVGGKDPSQMSQVEQMAFSNLLKAKLPDALAAAGLSMNDAQGLAKQYGIDVEKDPMGWYKLLGVLKSRKFGSAQGNFTNELSSLQDSWGILGITDQDEQFQQIAAFLSENVNALKPVLSGASIATEAGRAALTGQLRQLYKDSLAGKLKPEDYGKATPAQFRTIIGTLLSILGGADGFLSSGNPVAPFDFSPPPAPTAGPSGGINISGGAGAGGTNGPSVPSGMPTFGLAGPAPIFGGLAETPGAISTVINGGVSVVVQLPDILNSPEAAEAVAQKVSDLLGANYQRQRDALGLS